MTVCPYNYFNLVRNFIMNTSENLRLYWFYYYYNHSYWKILDDQDNSDSHSGYSTSVSGRLSNVAVLVSLCCRWLSTFEHYHLLELLPLHEFAVPDAELPFSPLSLFPRKLQSSLPLALCYRYRFHTCFSSEVMAPLLFDKYFPLLLWISGYVILSPF